jgi:hypothetical protein
MAEYGSSLILTLLNVASFDDLMELRISGGTNEVLAVRESLLLL